MKTSMNAEADPGFDRGGGGGPDRDRPKTAILGPQFCRILVLGPHFWWSGGAQAPPGSAPGMLFEWLCIVEVKQPVQISYKYKEDIFLTF